MPRVITTGECTSLRIGYPFPTAFRCLRGRGNSEGVFSSLDPREAQDGYDIVEWLAKQPYCDGKVSMWGGSYAGYDQWATAKEFPPHLATIVPVASPYASVDFPMSDGVFYTYDMQWLLFVSGHTSQDHIFADDPFWVAKFRQWYESGSAFTKLDAGVGSESAIFQEWVAHPQSDAYWDRYNPTSEQYSKLSIPILTITGSHDGDQPGALAHYHEYMKNASPEARARHYLVIGPWDHAGTRTPDAHVGGLTFGPASLRGPAEAALGLVQLDDARRSEAGIPGKRTSSITMSCSRTSGAMRIVWKPCNGERTRPASGLRGECD